MSDRETLLIATSGFANSKFLEAIKDARLRDYASSMLKYDEGNLNLDEAMRINAELTLLNEPPTLLMVHAHNHLMNALMMKDLASELVAFIKDVRDD